MTTYDDIFTCFLNNCGIDTRKLPQSEDRIYDMIQNSIRHYNSYMRYESPIVGENSTESINKSLDDTRLLILAFCLKYVYLENELIGFQELWSPFKSEIGLKDYKAQTEGREETLKRTKQKIIELKTFLSNPNVMA